MTTIENLKTKIDLNKTNIVLGKGYAIKELVHLIQDAQKAETIENDFDFLPSPVVHHENYEINFKGFLWEHKNPIIFVQNKEFLEACLNSTDNRLSVISTDFNVVQVDLEPIRDEEGNLTFTTDSQGNKEVNAKLVFKTYSKEDAKELMIEKNIDLREVSFGGYGEI
jgi:hypothetical protein